MNVHSMHIYVNPKSASAILEGASTITYDMCMPRTYRKTFLREWRKAKPGRTLEVVAAELHISRTQLGRIEKGQQPYNQDLLEVLADLYGCEVVDLLIRDPSKPENIWSLWDRAKPGERSQIVKLASVIVGDQDRDGTHGF